MRSNLKFFKKSKSLPIDKFFDNVLYDKKFGYYSSKNPFGKKGDFITAPKISKLYSEIIAIWIISTWERFGKPKTINIVELGPGDASLIKEMLEVFKKFPKFYMAKKIYLYEKSEYLKIRQKKVLKNKKIKYMKKHIFNRKEKKQKKKKTLFFFFFFARANDNGLLLCPGLKKNFR